VEGGQLFDVDFHFESLEKQSALVLCDKVIFGFFKLLEKVLTSVSMK
jgi:hypothetical protein